MCVTVSVKGGVPITFYQNNPSNDNEISAEFIVDVANYGVPGIKAYYSLKSNLSLFSSFYYDFIPHSSTTIGLSKVTHTIKPNSLSYHIGTSYFFQNKQNSSNRYGLSLGVGRSLIEISRYYEDNSNYIKRNSIESSITTGFSEFNYIFVRENVEHYISLKFRARLYHKHIERSYSGDNVIVDFELDDNQQLVYDFIPGYGFKYNINNFKIGFQVGIGFPLNKLKDKEPTDYFSSVIKGIYRGLPIILNANIIYAFELK